MDMNMPIAPTPCGLRQATRWRSARATELTGASKVSRLPDPILTLSNCATKTTRMNSKRLQEALKIAFALPILQITHLLAYANTREGWPAKVATAVVLLPIFVLTATCWAAIWLALLWLAYQLVK
jgi:hypothetical protein